MPERDPHEAALLLLPIAEAGKIPQELCRAAFPDRYARAERRKNEPDRLACLAAGALLSYAGIAERDIAYSPSGKPTAPDAGFFFSLSHDRNFAVLAKAPCEVGVDTEPLSPPKPSASRFMTEEELSWIAEDPAARFSTLWTLKESVSKCDGRGLAIGFSSFSVLPLTRGEPLLLGEKTYFGRSFFIDGCVVSAVFAEKCEKITYEILGTDACLGAVREIAERKDHTN